MDARRLAGGWRIVVKVLPHAEKAAKAATDVTEAMRDINEITG